jgi:parvulin-like peptidyl-prolyl isomerase
MMRSQRAVVSVLVAVLVQALVVLGAAAQSLPVRNGRSVVATVNADSISLDEFVSELGPSADVARLRQGRGTAADFELLDRLVTIKLIVQEATTMGLAEAPEVQKQVEVTSREILREVLYARLTRDVRPDPAAVDKVFKDLVREWKTTSLLFQDKAAAERAQKQIAAGAPFADVAARAVTAKAAKTDGDDQYHPRSAYLPQILEAMAPLQGGQVSPVIQIPAGFVVLRVVGMRYPQNAEALAEARKRVLNLQQEVVLKAHEQVLRRQYVTFHKAVLDGLDYAAPRPGLDALLRDKRAIADIKGGAPITVGDLTDYLRMQFYHGSDQARQFKRMNEMKGDAFDAMVGRRLVNAEALRLGIDRTNEYRDRVRGYRESLVFDSFIQKVIVPTNKMTEPEVRKYYDTHLKDYSSPEMMRIRGLAFARRSAAEDAMRKLREGADFGWLVNNAEGQVPKGTAGLLTLDGRLVTIGSMPDGLRKATASARAGEYRLYASPEGPVYVLAVQAAVAPTPQPYDDMRAELAKKLYNEKLKKAVEAYAAKLRAHSKVETYLTRVR